MPLVTLTVRPKSALFKASILDAIQVALVSSGVPTKKKFQRVIELCAEDFHFDPTNPDLDIDHTDDFVLIEILWSVDRSVKVKKQLIEEILDSLAGLRMNLDHVMVRFKEPYGKHCSFRGGRLNDI